MKHFVPPKNFDPPNFWCGNAIVLDLFIVYEKTHCNRMCPIRTKFNKS